MPSGSERVEVREVPLQGRAIKEEQGIGGLITSFDAGMMLLFHVGCTLRKVVADGSPGSGQFIRFKMFSLYS